MYTDQNGKNIRMNSKVKFENDYWGNGEGVISGIDKLGIADFVMVYVESMHDILNIPTEKLTRIKY